MAKCVELVAVYDDGTVERWEGQDLACKLPMPVIYDAPCVGDRAEDLREAKHTTTKPLRRVTVMRGQVCNPGDAFINVWGDASDGGHYPRIDVRFLPEELLDGRPVEVRITVEAVPVEGDR